MSQSTSIARPCGRAVLTGLCLLATVTAAQPIVATPLPVTGYHDASHVGPRGASARPLVVVLHGNYDRPEWECDLWSGITAGETWVLCTRGTRRAGTSLEEDRWTYASLAAAREELQAVERTLRAKYPGRVAEGTFVLAGMSLGAAHARSLALEDPARFSRVVLVEGGSSGWDDKTSRRFAKAGGKDVTFVCGQESCATAARKAVATLKAAGVSARLIEDLAAGHNYSELINAALVQHWREISAIPEG